MKSFLSCISLVVVFFLTTAVQPVLGASLNDQINTQINSSANKAEIGDTIQSPQLIVVGLIKTALSVFGMIFLGLVVYGGFTIFSARGAAEQVESGLDTIRRAVIGLAIVMAAYSLSYAIGKIIQNSIS